MYHPYVFRHRNAIFSQSKKTRNHKFNTPLKPLLALTVILEIQSDSFGTRPKKMRISQRLFIRF